MSSTQTYRRGPARAAILAAALLAGVSLTACSSTGQYVPSAQVTALGLGQDADDGKALKTPVSVPTLPTADLGAPGTLRHSVASALVRDPSVRQVYLGLGSSSVGIAAAEALAGPRVSLAGFIGATDNGGQTQAVRTGGLGLDLTIKLFDGGQDELAVDAERHKSLSALAAVAKEVDGSTLEADQAHTEVLRYRARVKAARDHVAAMQRDLADIRALVAKKASSDAADLPDTSPVDQRRRADAAQAREARTP